MKDELKKCGSCGHDHPWGILRHSKDNVPLYGPRNCTLWMAPGKDGKFACDCVAETFSHYDEDAANLPAMTQEQIKELWSQTDFMNPQAPLATRLMVAQVMSAKDPAVQQKEFMGLMISQLTDLRGAMFRDESKFAHLVAHTDEIVESMRNVGQLTDRLKVTNARLERIEEVLYRQHVGFWRRLAQRIFSARGPDLDEEAISVENERKCNWTEYICDYPRYEDTPYCQKHLELAKYECSA